MDLKSYQHSVDEFDSNSKAENESSEVQTLYICYHKQIKKKFHLTQMKDSSF